MISNEELKGFSGLSSERVFITAKALKEMATELLQLREENARLTFLWNRVEDKNGYHEATECTND